MFRVMLILGVLVLVPAVIVFWRMRDRAGMTSPPPPVRQKAIGTSTLNHGDSRPGEKVLGASPLHPSDPRPEKGVAMSPNRSDRRP
jgi:hypothetical protein